MIKWLPVGICIYSLKEKKTSVLRTFMFLKLAGEVGYLNLNTDLIKEIGKSSGNHSRTVKNHIKQLAELGWLNINRNTIYLRSFKRIENILKASYKRKAEFKESYLNEGFREYIFAIFIAKLIINQKYKRIQRKLGKPYQNIYKGNSSHHDKAYPGYFPVANLAISKILKLSISSAQRCKNSSYSKGFIEIKSSFIPTAYSKEQINFYRGQNILEEERFKLINNTIHTIGPDLLKSNIRLKRSKP